MATDEDNEHARSLQRRRLSLTSPRRETRHRCRPSLRPQDGSHSSSPQDRCCPAPRHRPTRTTSTSPPLCLLLTFTSSFSPGAPSRTLSGTRSTTSSCKFLRLPSSCSHPSSLPPVRYYLKSYTQKQINAFATYVPGPFTLTITHTHPAMPPATLNSITPLAPLRSLTPLATLTRPASPSSASLLPASSSPAPSSPNSRAPWPISQTRRTGTSKRPASVQATSGVTLVSSTQGP